MGGKKGGRQEGCRKGGIKGCWVDDKGDKCPYVCSYFV